MRSTEEKFTKMKEIKFPTSIFIFYILVREKPKCYLNRNRLKSKHKKLNI